jgi:hypothetical protein
MAKKATKKKATPRTKPTLYAVRWRKDCYFYYDGTERTQPGNRYVKAFTSQEAAKKYVNALHCGEVPPPEGANPFMSFRSAAGGRYVHELPKLDSLTSFPEPVFLDYVRDLDLTPPPVKKITPRYGKSYSLRDWDSWWEEHAPHMTDAQRAQIWKALDRLTFYEVVQTGMEE